MNKAGDPPCGRAVSKQLKTRRGKTAAPPGGRTSPPGLAQAAAAACLGPLTASLPCRVQVFQHPESSQPTPSDQPVALSLSPLVCVYIYIFIFCLPGGSYLTQAHPGDREALVPDHCIKATITMKQVTNSVWFPSSYKSYVQKNK